MPFDYIRGIMRPDGKVCIEYQVTGEEEPGQILSEEDFCGRADRDIIETMQGSSPVFDDPDYMNITINREWYESKKP